MATRAKAKSGGTRVDAPKLSPEEAYKAPLAAFEKLVDKAVSVTFETPSPVLAWMDTLQQADNLGRIKKSKMSALYYALYHYTLSHVRVLVDFPQNMDCMILDLDGVRVKLQLTICDVSGNNELAWTEWETVWPDWLFDFFDDEEHEALLDPACKEKLMEVLQILHENTLVT